MRDLAGRGPYKDVVKAPSPLDPNVIVEFGIRKETFRLFESRRLASAIAQYYGIVQGDIIFSRHAFRGLKRPLMLADDMAADQNVVVYTWRSRVDYEWDGSPYDGSPRELTPPECQVFAVLVREEQPNEYGVSGSIEKWNWIREDPALPHAPIDWRERYSKNLWSQGI